MTRCRQTDAIADVAADPALGPDALTADQQRHVAICAACHATVRGLDRLDRSLTSELRSLRREELPISVLATPPLPRREPEEATPAGVLMASAAVAVTIAVALGGYAFLRDARLGLGPGSSATPAPTQQSPASPAASDPAPPTPAPPPVAELSVGEVAAVIDDNLVVRTEPGTEPDTTITDDRLWIGQRVRILGGPVESDGYTWWEVELGEIRGWVADGERDGGAPWVTPIGNGRIAFSRVAGDGVARPTLFTINPDGSDERVLGAPTAGGMRLVLTCGDGIGPARWSHDGQWAAFDHTLGGCERTVSVVRADGSDLRQLAEGHGPAWRPNGGAIAFAENSDYLPCGRACGGDGESGPWNLMTADLETGEVSPFTGLEPWSGASGPAWSPDRRSIAFGGWTIPEPEAAPDGGWDGVVTNLYLADADGSNVRLLTIGQSPVWSPDGRWIVFTVATPDGTSELRRIRPDGTDEASLGEGSMPAFSPDGSRIAFVRDEWGVFTMAPDGSDAAGAIPAASVAGLDWSPDGTHLVVAADYAGAFGLYRVALDGAAPALSGLGLVGVNPTWQPVLLARGPGG